MIYSISWIIKNKIMTKKQKVINFIIAAIIPLIWIVILKMVFKSIPGYKKRNWNEIVKGTSGDSMETFDGP